jgi:hypothetical protein
LVNFLEKVGFSVIDLSTNKIQGGSLRILLQKKKLTKSIEKIKKFIKSEERFFKTTKIKNKFNTFEKNLLKLNLQITQEMVKDKPVYAFGSPTKASLLLIKSNLNKNTIKNSFEDNTLKCDKYIPGTDIKIINIKKIKKIDNSIIINLAWNFSKEVKNKLTKLNIKNTILLTPLPTIKAIKL